MTTAEKLFHSLFSPPRPIHESKDHEPEDEDHNKNSAETGISSRCQFTFSDGRQCRNESASLCRHHSSRKQRESSERDFPDAALEGLDGLCGDLTTATNINRALSQVFLLMAQGRISQKQAVAFGYISQLLLQTVPGIRSEYVSVHGYRDWEANLKSKITSQIPTPAAQNEPPASAPPPAQPSPDYGDLLRRSRDMMAGKYDTTPEGRREANALALELELMNPAPAKPRKDFFGRTVALVRRLRDSRRERDGHQELRGVEHLRCERHGHQELRSVKEVPPTTAPTPVPSSATPAPPPPVAAFEAAAKAAIPAASPPSPSDSNAPSDRSPKARPKQEMPVPGITLTRTGHTTSWYAPASWSGRQPDPFPSRKERLRRSLQTMGDRRRQHQMQNRAFWR